MYLVLGDPSNDGHGKVEKVILNSSVSVGEIRAAYKESCRKTGIEFNHNDDYTGLKKAWTVRKQTQIACDYDNPFVNNESFLELSKFGLTVDILSSYDPEIDQSDYDTEEDGYYLSSLSFTKLWIWFVKLSLPDDVELNISNEKVKIPSINGVDELNVQFGYGLFGS